MATENIVVVSWDCTGLETIYPIQELEQQHLMGVLRGDKPNKRSIDQTVGMIVIRARANPQRFYEVYAVNLGDIAVDELRELFESCPQVAADLVREKGQVIYSNRRNSKTVVIT